MAIELILSNVMMAMISMETDVDLQEMIALLNSFMNVKEEMKRIKTSANLNQLLLLIL